MDVDYLISESRREQHEFDDAMLAHIQTNPKGCNPMGDCVYCLTYGQRLWEDRQ